MRPLTCVSGLASRRVRRTKYRCPTSMFVQHHQCDFSTAAGARLTPFRAGIGLDSTKSAVIAPCEVQCRAAQAALDGVPPVTGPAWHRPREVGPEHMPQNSGHIRVIAYFHVTFKDFYRNWTVGTARKRRRRREEERGGGVWILVWGFPQGVECD